MYNVFEKNKEKLIKYLENKKEILAVFLFGSFCDNTYNEKSDIDIAVLYNTKIYPLEHDSMAIEIEKNI